ncbi:hypothetical protein CKO15_13405 [Halorhodospira abdelmalekii]|nr:hypothetical protein [Halorhodospira abdelmalekii]
MVTELERLERRKRRAYIIGVVLLAGLIGSNALQVTLQVAAPPINWVHIVTWSAALVLVALLPALLTRRVPLLPTEIGLYVTGSVIVLVGLAELLLVRDGPVLDRLPLLLGLQYWALGILIIMGFLMLGRWGGLILGTLVLATSAGLTAITIVGEASAGHPTQELLFALIRMHVLLLVVLVLVWVLTGLREQIDRALERADLLANLAMTDPLTGLANRYAAEERFGAELANARRSGQPLAVLMLDLDHFKRINDSHGHDAGDQVLVSISKAIQAEMRGEDLLARWGGEELVALLPHTDLDGAAYLAERCRAAVAGARPLNLMVTASIGAAELAPDESYRSLLQRADLALYRAKSSGRNQVVLANDNPVVDGASGA